MDLKKLTNDELYKIYDESVDDKFYEMEMIPQSQTEEEHEHHMEMYKMFEADICRITSELIFRGLQF